MGEFAPLVKLVVAVTVALRLASWVVDVFDYSDEVD